MEPVRVGVVGVGGMGAFHARTLAKLAGVEIWAVADPDLDAAQRVAEDVGAFGLSDPLEVAGSPHVDGVVIASPDRFHAEQTLAAIATETPTLCEKPLATATEDALRVMSAETDHGSRLVQVGFMREYDPAHVQVQGHLAEFGTVHTMRAVHLNANDFDRPIELIVGQSLVHDVHSVRFLSGAEFTSVRAVTTHKPSGAVRCVTALCTLSTGGHAVIEFDDAAYAYVVSVEITTDRGSVTTGGQTRATVHQNGEQHVHIGADWFGRFAEAYRLQDQAWVDAVRAGTTVGPSVWDGLVGQAVAEAMLRSIDTGDSCPVILPDRPTLYDPTP